LWGQGRFYSYVAAVVFKGGKVGSTPTEPPLVLGGKVGSTPTQPPLFECKVGPSPTQHPFFWAVVVVVFVFVVVIVVVVVVVVVPLTQLMDARPTSMCLLQQATSLQLQVESSQF
jgi:hypothetical protein